MEVNYNEVINHIDNSKDYLELVDKITFEHTQNLNNLIQEINMLIQSDRDLIDLNLLQVEYLKLSVELFNMVDKLKKFEIYSSLAKANEAESYNNSYLAESVAYEKKPSATELQVRAEAKSKKESLINTIYKSAFQLIKSKIDAGNAVADTLKNILKVKSNLEYTANSVFNSSAYGGN